MKRQFFLNSTKNIEIEPLTEVYLYKSLLSFFTGLVYYYEKSDERYLKDCYVVIKSFALTDMTELSQELKKFLD